MSFSIMTYIDFELLNCTDEMNTNNNADKSADMSDSEMETDRSSKPHTPPPTNGE